MVNFALSTQHILVHQCQGQQSSVKRKERFGLLTVPPHWKGEWNGAGVGSGGPSATLSLTNLVEMEAGITWMLEWCVNKSAVDWECGYLVCLCRSGHPIWHAVCAHKTVSTDNNVTEANKPPNLLSEIGVLYINVKNREPLSVISICSATILSSL